LRLTGGRDRERQLRSNDVIQDAPWIPIANGTEVDLISRHVGNYQFNPFWGVLPDQFWVR
jgi:hypothetical protein